MRRTILTAFLAAAWPLCATPVKIHGYITDLSSPKSFAIDDYRIARDESLAFELDKGDYPDAAFGPEDLRVGTELEVQGDFNDSTHELHATSIKVFINDNLRVKRSAVVEHPAVLEREGNGFKGIIHADGQTIRVDGQTRVVIKEGQTNQLTPGVSINYEGRRNRDNSIVASKLEVLPNQAGRVEQKLWRDITPKLSDSGDISIRGVKYKLVPDAEAQSYVQRIGAKLIPSYYQHDLSGGAARRIPFQFYLIENPAFNAHAFPNGTVLINAGVLRVLSNEAQLAAVLGHEIAHATHEHAVRELQHQKKSGRESEAEKGYAEGTRNDPLNNSYSRSLENQADRVGLEYMVSAGYDPREAAEVWTQVAHSTGNKQGFWNSHDDSTARRSYLLAELRNNYAGIDFQSYVRDREEFDVLAERFGNTAIAKHAPEVPAQPPKVDLAESRPGYVKSAQIPSIVQTSRVVGGSIDVGGANAVIINSAPAGADVVIDGRVIGKTPMTLPTGNVGLAFVITVQKPGYRGWTGQLVSVPGRTNLRVDLQPAQ